MDSEIRIRGIPRPKVIPLGGHTQRWEVGWQWEVGEYSNDTYRPKSLRKTETLI